MPVRELRLYTRPGCHLCEDAADLLEHLSKRIPIHVTEVNILNDYDLYERYKYSIPVVAIVGGPALEAPLRPEQLEQLLLQSPGFAALPNS